MAALKKNPLDFGDYETIDESVFWDYSKRVFNANIETDEQSIEKNFSNYCSAKEWLKEQEEQEDTLYPEGIVRTWIEC